MNVIFKHCLKITNKKRYAQIIFQEEVNDNSITHLIDAIDNAFNYFNYDGIELVLQSPGGSIVSMQILLDKFKKYQNEGKVLATKGYIDVASAAAIILSAGTIGERSADKYCRILHHNSRVCGKNMTITSEDAKKYSEELDLYDKEFIKLLAGNGRSAWYYRIKQGENKEENTKYYFEKLSETIRDIGIEVNELDRVKSTEEAKDDTACEILRYIYKKITEKGCYLTSEQAYYLLLVDKVE